MKVAIIGGGFAAGLHAQAAKKAGAEVALVSGRSGESAKRAAEALGASGYAVIRDGILDEALFSDEIDAVHICTPPTVHASYAYQLIRRGKPVLCEKPLAADAAQAAEMARMAKEGGTVAAMVLNVRFHAACQRARQIMLSGELGEPLLIHGSYLQEFHALPCPYDWRYDPLLAGEGRAVTEIGTHWFDIAQYISGRKITAVSAFSSNFHPVRRVRDNIMYPAQSCGQETIQENEDGLLQVSSEDSLSAHLRFEGGAAGNVLLSEISSGRGNRLFLEIVCENGSLWWNEEDNNRLYTARKGEGIREELFAFGNGFGDTFEALVASFYESVRAARGAETGGSFIPCPGFDEGEQIARICGAALRSAKEGSAWINVEEDLV